MKADYLIIGQGICGTLLSWNLLKRGKKVFVIDDAFPFSASKVASGIINPVTGRRIVTTWMAEELLPFVWKEYSDFGEELKATIIEQKNTIVFPPSFQMKETYEKRMTESDSFIQSVQNPNIYNHAFNFIFDCYAIEPTYIINLHTMMHNWKKELIGKQAFINENFDEAHLNVNENSITYKNIEANKIIFCNGNECFKSNYWKNLPYVYNKGQAMLADIPDLSTNNIYKFGAITLAPWYDGLWWIGSSYENEFDTIDPTDAFKTGTEKALQSILRLPFTIIDHFAAIRPATIERRPFVGLHPYYNTIGIFNGMGTKGCSLAPYFAKQFADYLTTDKPIDALADVKRFGRILGKTETF